MKLHPKEIENVSKLEPFERYKYFIRRIADSMELWSIVDGNGDVGLSDVEDKTLVPFWTAEDFVSSNLSGAWQHHEPFKFDLDNLDDIIIPFIVENNYLIDVFPINGKSGFVVSSDEFIRDLKEELEQYE